MTKGITKLRDRDIRQALIRKVVPALNKPEPCRVIHELGVLAGSIRIDIAVANGKLHGFEIKSDADTLERLDSQMCAYSKIFDRLTLVCGVRHATECSQYLPQWWGLSIARFSKNGVKIEVLRKPSDNPDVDALSLLSLLWKEEILKLIALSPGKLKTKGVSKLKLAEIAAVNFSLSELKEYVRNTLKFREQWRNDPLPV